MRLIKQRGRKVTKEDRLRCVEAHLMLFEVCGSLGRIPVESLT
jgi:hypothetical protein